MCFERLCCSQVPDPTICSSPSPLFAGTFILHTVLYFMEALPRRDLFQSVADAGGLSEDDARPLFRQMLSCVRGLHDAGICHCDLGLESFVFASGADHLTLIHMHSSHQYPWDITEGGFNRSMPPPQSKNMNYQYVAPEKVCSFEADMWSLGVCLFAIVKNALPVCDDRKTAAPLSSLLDNKFSPGLVDLIDGLLAVDPQQRLNVMEAQQHTWVTGGVCVKRAMSHASTASVSSQQQQRRCVQCGTTETCKWRCRGTMCNMCGLRKPGGVSQKEQQQMQEQLLAAGFAVERKPRLEGSGKSGFRLHSPHGHYFQSIKSAYKFYAETSRVMPATTRSSPS